MKPTLPQPEFTQLAVDLFDDFKRDDSSKLGIQNILEKYIGIRVGVDERPTRDQMMMDMARVAAKRGTCCRLKVGAVLAYQGRVISIGYNGARPGHAHCTPSTCNDSSPCLNTIHAEANVINWAKTMGISDFSKMQLFITHTPCLNCAKLIIESGVGEVVYGEAYRCDRGLVCLNQSGTLTVRKVG